MPREAAHRIRLNKTNVAGLPVPAKPAYAWDSDLQGFGVRLSPSGRRTFIVVGTTAAGKQIKHKVGVFGRITPEQAREIATRKLGELAAGHDLAAERRQARAAERARLAAPTLQELADAYLDRHARVHKRTAANDEHLLRKWILPHLGAGKRASEVTHGDIASLHRAMRERPYQANRCLSLVGTMFEKGRGWGLLNGPNPAKGGITKFREHPRSRYLDGDEIARLLAALDRHPRRASALAIKLLLLTGARRSEALGARWSEFDLDDAIWHRPHYRLKQRKDHHLPLSPAAVDILRELAADQEATRAKAKKRGVLVPPAEHLFPAGTNREHLTEVAHTWASVQRAAGLHDCRLHDLRHSFASIAVSSGMSLPMIGALLGHSSPSTTSRYAHLLDQPLREAATAIADRIAEFARQPAKVVSLPKPPAKS
jgi:integrase